MTELNLLVRDALISCALFTFVTLIAMTVLGVLVAIVQAATQIQEQTLTLLPKIATVAVLGILFGHYSLDRCADLLRDAVAAFPSLISGAS